MQDEGTSGLQALSVATIIRIPHSAIRAAAARYPALAEALWRDCMVDAAILAEWVFTLGRREAKSRMAHLLCEMAWRFRAEPTAEAGAFHFTVTQAQLADVTGVTAVHVNRVLKALRKDWLVEMGHGVVRIRDRDGLVALGDFDPAYLQTGIKPRERLMIVQTA